MSHVIDVHSHACLKVLKGIQAAIDNFPHSNWAIGPMQKKGSEIPPGA